MVARRNTNIRAASPLQDCCEPQISISFAQQKLTSSMVRCCLYLQTTSGVLVWVRLSLSGASKLGKKSGSRDAPGSNPDQWVSLLSFLLGWHAQTTSLHTAKLRGSTNAPMSTTYKLPCV